MNLLIVTNKRKCYSTENFSLFASKQGQQVFNGWSLACPLALFSSKKFCKIFQIPSHIESLDTYMKY